ncbi:MAG: ABC transporter substrate-binding protein, partial [Methylococcales bacterium]|nr:ABC transporter substrate-binding protein [Methylococcales bacterium]
MIISSHVWPGYDLMFLAQKQGWLVDPNLKLLTTQSATDSIMALSTGQVDGAALTLDEVLLARDKGIPLTIVLVFDISAGADMVLSRAKINSLSELKGKRIG